eukprot:scaffold33193_cov70-Cyclotella_meneghiniana.AAC.5
MHAQSMHRRKRSQFIAVPLIAPAVATLAVPPIAATVAMFPSQPQVTSASQKSNSSHTSTANKSQRHRASDPDGINADELLAPSQPPR